jgi:hypothetical protein
VTLSCNNSEKKSSKISTDENITEAKSIYSIDTSGTTVIWTAYKFTDKVGVKGSFDKFVLSPKTKSGSVENILQASRLSINTMSVNSDNNIRDPKLKESFFKIFHTDTIRGEILKANQNKGTLALEMNSITKNIPFSYSLKTDTIFISTTINLKEWNGEEAISTLNKVCYDLHKGTDGISKLWPDVSVSIKLPVNKK